MILLDYGDSIALSIRQGVSFYIIDCYSGEEGWEDNTLSYPIIKSPYFITNDTERLFVSNQGDIILTPHDIEFFSVRCLNLDQDRIEFFTIESLEPLPRAFYVKINA